MLMLDRFQIILPTPYYPRRSHAWPGSDDHLFPLVHLDDIMSVSCAQDSLTDRHYHWYNGTSGCRTPLYRECEYEGGLGATAAFRRCWSGVHWKHQWQVNFRVMEIA